jgi:hypothetical protein
MPPLALEKSGSLETNVTDRTVSVVKPFGIRRFFIEMSGKSA